MTRFQVLAATASDDSVVFAPLLSTNVNTSIQRRGEYGHGAHVLSVGRGGLVGWAGRISILCPLRLT